MFDHEAAQFLGCWVCMGAHFNTVKILSLGTVGKFCKIEKQQNVPIYLIYFVSTYINEILI